MLEKIGPRLFCLPEEVLNDEEATWDKASFIIECLSLYRLLLLKQNDQVISFMIWLIVDGNKKSRPNYADT
jgi:hypothetical protein